jgi:pyruvate kinase
MKNAERKLIGDLVAKLQCLCDEMIRLEPASLHNKLSLHQEYQRSARNLVHYLALRRHDLRSLQADLVGLGLSSLGRTESHVLSSIQRVIQVLNVLLGRTQRKGLVYDAPVEIGKGGELLDRHTRALLGRDPKGRKVRIMVTMPTEASTDYALVRDLLRSGMDCMRINCAHDGPEVWLGMIRNLERAKKETRRACRIEMDLAGPKLRTASIESGVAVVRARPEKDELGRVIRAARIWLGSTELRDDAPAEARISLRASGHFVSRLRRGDVVRFRDARGSQRSMQVVKPERRGCWVEVTRTAYFMPGMELEAVSSKADEDSRERWKGEIGTIPAKTQRLLLKPGEMLIVTRSSQPGRLAVRDRSGAVVTPAHIGVTLPEFFQHAKAGEAIWFDDGKIGGTIRSVDGTSVRVEITQARPEGELLGEGKGINLPDTRLEMPALTEEDIEALKFVVQHADLVAYSFVRSEADVRRLLECIDELKGKSPGIVLKIETREAFENLPGLILVAMARKGVGVMIARGDLAVECGYQRLAEVQEEILWICEAAHIPVIWATQVLETLSKKGIPSRSEITDAAMGERAECVMLNKGPYVVMAVRALDDILRRMQAHHQKKRSMLRRLRVATSFAAAG